ncbi:DUF3137 domain-containing protein [Flagellimonas sp.]|uniref:DUF3137 domain-containing protein n=1 Tax=Flagellimonas sp. TaxID=2058762 RepID=UPI003BA9FDEA
MEKVSPLLQKAEKLRRKYRLYHRIYTYLILLFIIGMISLPLIISFNNIGFNRWMKDFMPYENLGLVQPAMILYWFLFFVMMTASHRFKNKFKQAEREILKIALDDIAPEFKLDSHKQIHPQQIAESKLLPSFTPVKRNKKLPSLHNLNFGVLWGKVSNSSILMGDVNIINQGIYNSYLMFIPLLPHLLVTYNLVRPLLSKHRSTEYFGSHFVGMFAVVDFPKKFKGHTVILPDTLEKRVGYLAQTLQSLNLTRGQLVKMEDPEFEKHFVVYGTDQIEARYLLSPSLMQRIIRFYQKINKPILLSFHKNKLYMGVRHAHGFLSLDKKKNLTETDVFGILYEDITTAVGIVEDLNLNGNIWNTEASVASN